MQQSRNSNCLRTQTKSTNATALRSLEGTIRRLESTLSFTKWKRFYFSLEGDKLCFYKNKHEIEHVDIIDLKDVSDISQKVPDKLREDEKWQIKVSMNWGKTYYFCTEKEEELRHILESLQNWLNYFRKEQQSSLQELKSNGTPKFLISNSEHRNAINLREYYAIRGESKSGKFVKDPNESPVVNLSTRAVYRTKFSKNEQNPASISDSHNDAFPPHDTDPCSLNQWMSDDGTLLCAMDDLDQFQRKEILRLKQQVSDLKKRESALKGAMEAMAQSFHAKELEYKKQIKEKHMQSEAEKKKFNLIVNSKEFFVEKLEQEKRNLINSEIEHLKCIIDSKDRELKEQALQLAYKEVKLLDCREQCAKLERYYQLIIASHLLKADKQISELKNALEAVRSRYFDTLASSFTNCCQCTLDYSDMYEQCLKEQIPLESWHKWLRAHMEQGYMSKDDEEEENVHKF